MSSPEVLEPLARWGATCGRQWKETALARARAALGDTFACMAAGVEDPSCEAAYALAGGGDCVAVGRSRRATPEIAALINATAAHALDFDDNFAPARIHASAVMFPALLALSESKNKKLCDVLDAFIVGLEIAGRIGELVNPRHRNRGWHATATLGAVAAAAACARLLRLEKTPFRHAIALATSRAGGSMIQFGMTAKPLHAGFAAEAGVICALLAEAGATAAAETISGSKGFADLMGAGAIAGVKPEAIGAPLLIDTAGLKAKRFPNCASAHRSMDALLAIMEREPFGPADVDRIDVDLPAPQLANLMYPAPQTAAEARFSLNYALAVTLSGGPPGIDDFTDGAVARSNVTSLLNLIHATPADTTEIDYPTKVLVRLKDKREFSNTVSYPKGAARNPFTAEEFETKARSCLAVSPLASKSDEIIAALNLRDDLPVRELMALLAV